MHSFVQLLQQLLAHSQLWGKGAKKRFVPTHTTAVRRPSMELEGAKRKDNMLGGHNVLNAEEKSRTADVTTSLNSRSCAPKKHKCFSLEASVTRCD